jgi:hypothetical protein
MHKIIQRPDVIIAFCIPTRGLVSMEWANHYRDIGMPMNCNGFPVIRQDNVGGEIAEVRNACVELALARGASHLFWIDDDVCVNRFGLARLFRDHLDSGRDIVSGVYFTKEVVSEPLIFSGPGQGTMPFLAKGTCDAYAHGFGVCLVKADFYRKMAKEIALPRDKYGRSEFYRTRSIEDATLKPVADGVVQISAGCTEDFYFLDLAAKLGSKSLVDMSPEAFGWHFNPYTKQGYPIEQFNQRCEGKPVVWNTPGGEVVWE